MRENDNFVAFSLVSMEAADPAIPEFDVQGDVVTESRIEVSSGMDGSRDAMTWRGRGQVGSIDGSGSC